MRTADDTARVEVLAQLRKAIGEHREAGRAEWPKYLRRVNRLERDDPAPQFAPEGYCPICGRPE